MERTVLITGVGGFLGTYVARHFVREGWRVIGIDELPPEKVLARDVEYHRMELPESAFDDLLKAQAPAVCVHCAGRASVGASMEYPAPDFRGNTVLVQEILEALRRNAPACRFLLLSSAAVYGDPATLPVTESHAIQPLSPYGYHKRQAELLCEEYSRIYGLPTAVARIFSAYGPGLRRQVVWDACKAALTTGRLALRGTGAESRDFIHAEDCARGLQLLATTAQCQGEIYNLASGREVTIRELAGLIVKSLSLNVDVTFDGVVPAGNPLYWRADITRIRALGFEPEITMEHGVDAFSRWCKEQLQRP